MSNQKSSRKLSILAAIFILLTGVFIGGYLVLKSGRISASQLDNILQGKTFSQLVCQPDANDSNKDSDNDGLKDWQEIQIYKTDACKQDTDGDGYLDGEEVASGYDPTQKAPGDELPGTTPRTPRPLPENLTKALSETLAKNITNGKIGSFSVQNELLTTNELAKYPALQQSIEAITNNSDQLFQPDQIDQSQIKTTTDNSKKAIAAYTKSMISAMSSRIATPDEQETQLFYNAISTNSFTEIDQQLQRYQNAYEKCQRVIVPTSLLKLHLDLLNNFSSMIKIYQNIKLVSDDPLKALLAIEKYGDVYDQMVSWAKQFTSFIETVSQTNG